jgi:hypothetical protein
MQQDRRAVPRLPECETEACVYRGGECMSCFSTSEILRMNYSVEYRAARHPDWPRARLRSDAAESATADRNYVGGNGGVVRIPGYRHANTIARYAQVIRLRESGLSARVVILRLGISMRTFSRATAWAALRAAKIARQTVERAWKRAA